MVKRTKKEFKDYNEYKDRPFGVKWGTAYAMDDLIKSVRAGHDDAMKDYEALNQMSINEVDTLLTESYLYNRPIIIQLNRKDKLGRLSDSLEGIFKGEAYDDYFIFSDNKIEWDEVRNIKVGSNQKWFKIDPFRSDSF